MHKTYVRRCFAMLAFLLTVLLGQSGLSATAFADAGAGAARTATSWVADPGPPGPSHVNYLPIGKKCIALDGFCFRPKKKWSGKPRVGVFEDKSKNNWEWDTERRDHWDVSGNMFFSSTEKITSMSSRMGGSST